MSHQSTRGPHPKDPKLFGNEQQVEKLRLAVRDLSWLFGRDYPENASLKLVGDRYKLTKRQRLAVRRSACSEQSARHRRETQVNRKAIKDRKLVIDGFNTVITLETLISNGFLFKGRDGVIRDISGVHGSYRLLGVTKDAVEILVRYIKKNGVSEARWYFDQPVSNSGRLVKLVREIAQEQDVSTLAKTVFNPDRQLIDGGNIVVTSDSEVLNRCTHWLNLESLYWSLGSQRIIDLS